MFEIFFHLNLILTTVFAVIQAELAVALWGYAWYPPDSRRLSSTFPPDFYICFV